MIVWLLILLIVFYVGVGFFLDTRTGKVVSDIILTIVCLPMLVVIGVCKVLTKLLGESDVRN